MFDRFTRPVTRVVALSGAVVAAGCLYGFLTWPVVDVGWVMRVLCLALAVLQAVPMWGFRLAKKPPALFGWLKWLGASLAILYVGSQVAWEAVRRGLT